MAVGAEKNFDLAFPADYQGKEVAGKTAQFTITMKKVEAGVLPELDVEFAKSLGVADGDIAKMKADIRANLEREVKKRLQARLKSGVMQALYENVKLEAPKALISMDVERLIEQARADLAQRGVKQDVPLPPDMFQEQAKKRVSLGLILNELVKSNGLEAKPDQVRAVIDDFAHHPSAIAATIEGLRARLAPGERILAVLEPRSNTMKLGAVKAALAGSLIGADHSFCFAGGLGWDATEALAPLGNKASVHTELDALVADVATHARPGDRVLVMSNGGFGSVHQRLLDALESLDDVQDVYTTAAIDA
jgi:hypothetical protein